VIHGQQKLHIAFLGLVEQLPGQFDLVGLQRDFPISCPCAFKNV